MSIAEAGNAAYGFDTEFNEDSKTRKAKNTDYAKLNNAWSDSDGFGWWWLRSPGIIGWSAATVSNDGFCYDYDDFSSIDYLHGVRPALHINPSSSTWSKAGEATAVRNSDDEPTTDPTSIDKPISSSGPEQTGTPTAQPTPPSVATQNSVQTEMPVLKQFKLSSVKRAKNAKKITGRVSVSKASIKIKVGKSKKAYKKATVKGKKFTLKLNYKLKKKTKVIIKADKKGYKSVVKSYTVK